MSTTVVTPAPGPWRRTGATIKDAEGHSILVGLICLPWLSSSNEALAATLDLAAAAPELLQACEAALDFLASYGAEELSDQLRTAIASTA